MPPDIPTRLMAARVSQRAVPAVSAVPAVLLDAGPAEGEPGARPEGEGRVRVAGPGAVKRMTMRGRQRRIAQGPRVVGDGSGGAKWWLGGRPGGVAGLAGCRFGLRARRAAVSGPPVSAGQG